MLVDRKVSLDMFIKAYHACYYKDLFPLVKNLRNDYIKFLFDTMKPYDITGLIYQIINNNIILEIFSTMPVKYQEYALAYAISNINSRIVRHFIDLNVPITAKNMFNACAINNISIIKSLYRKSGIKPTKEIMDQNPKLILIGPIGRLLRKFYLVRNTNNWKLFKTMCDALIDITKFHKDKISKLISSTFTEINK